jgi:hypothetical protein
MRVWKIRRFTFPELLNRPLTSFASVTLKISRDGRDSLASDGSVLSVPRTDVRPFGKRVEILLYGSRSVLLLRHRFHWSTSQLALVATKKFKLSRCGWLPVNRRVSRGTDRLNMLRLCANAWPKKRLITFSMPMPDSTYCHASPACCHVQAVPVLRTSTIARGSLHGARAWIEQAIPDVSELNLPDSTLET